MILTFDRRPSASASPTARARAYPPSVASTVTASPRMSSGRILMRNPTSNMRLAPAVVIDELDSGCSIQFPSPLWVFSAEQCTYISPRDSGEREGPIAKQWEGEGHPCYPRRDAQ